MDSAHLSGLGGVVITRLTDLSSPVRFETARTASLRRCWLSSSRSRWISAFCRALARRSASALAADLLAFFLFLGLAIASAARRARSLILACCTFCGVPLIKQPPQPRGILILLIEGFGLLRTHCLTCLLCLCERVTV